MPKYQKKILKVFNIFLTFFLVVKNILHYLQSHSNKNNMKTTYIFDVYTYTNEFDYIVKTKKTIALKRASGRTAIEYLRKKYPDFLGYFIELNSIKNN